MTERAQHTPRRYGAWAGNPQGYPEDTACCVAVVCASDERRPILRQCGRKRGFGPDGLYCKQHDPAAVKERREAASERYRKQQQNSDWARLDRVTKELAHIKAQRDALLAACEALLSHVDSGRTLVRWSHDEGGEAGNFDAMRAAIARATGKDGDK